jgi:hypothetical protein
MTILKISQTSTERSPNPINLDNKEKRISFLSNESALNNTERINLPFNYFEWIKNQILNLGLLNDGWDGYNSISIHKEIIDVASNFIILLNSSQIEAITDCFPNPNGTLSIEWETDYGKMQLEIGLNNFSYFVKKEGHNPITVNEKNILSNTEKIKTDLDRFIEKALTF